VVINGSQQQFLVRDTKIGGRSKGSGTRCPPEWWALTPSPSWVPQHDAGVTINGGDVTATGLFVEHFQKDDVVWNGERRQTVFFQNELPYDAPDQTSWSARRRQRLGGLPGGPTRCNATRRGQRGRPGSLGAGERHRIPTRA